MAYNGSGGKRLCAGTDIDVERDVSGPDSIQVRESVPVHKIKEELDDDSDPVDLNRNTITINQGIYDPHDIRGITPVTVKREIDDSKTNVPLYMSQQMLDGPTDNKKKFPIKRKLKVRESVPVKKIKKDLDENDPVDLNRNTFTINQGIYDPNHIRKGITPLNVKREIDSTSNVSLHVTQQMLDATDNKKRLSMKRKFQVGHGKKSNGNNYMTGEPRRKRELPARPNHILLYTIINPAYPITVDVIHTISTPHGQVQRIVVFKKNGVQAMVEFESVESATRAKEALHGCDIYSGCCTLKIEFAKPERLNVFKNDQDSWDYTLSDDIPPVQRSAPLLQSPQYTGGRPQPYNPSTAPQASNRSCSEDSCSQHSQHSCEQSQNDMDYGSGGPPPPGMMKDRHGPPPPHHPVDDESKNYILDFQRDGRGYGPEGYGGEGFAPPPPMHHPSMPPQNQGGPPQQGAVMMVYGLDPQTVNADRLFNLCCLYGNVVRIKFLKTKEGTAMVQMGDGVSVERCVQNLNNVTVGDHTLTLAFSKQAYLSEVMNPYPLPDKSPSFKDYVGNKNNRFLTPASIHKNRIQPPSKVLHFFNTPPDVSDEQLLQVFKDYGVTPPHTISKFPLKSERSSSGLMEFQNISHSVMAIMACNHATIQHPGAKFPFVMKLCFSSSRQIGQSKGPMPASGQKNDNQNQRQPQNNGMAEHEYY